MVLNGRVSGIEMPSARTDWGHNSPNTLQPGHPVSMSLLSAPTCSKVPTASLQLPMAFRLFIIHDNCAKYFESGKQIFLLAFPSSWFEFRVVLRELVHTACLLSPKTGDLGECTTVRLPTSVPQVLRVFLCSSRSRSRSSRSSSQAVQLTLRAAMASETVGGGCIRPSLARGSSLVSKQPVNELICRAGLPIALWGSAS